MPSYVGSKTDPIPPNESGYRSRLKSVEDVDGKYGKQVQVTFAVTTGKFKDRKIIGWTDDVPPTEKNRIGRWLGNLSGRDFLPVGEEVDTDFYIGQLFDVHVTWNRDGSATRLAWFKPVGQPKSAPPVDEDDDFNESIDDDGEPTNGALPNDDDIPF